MFPNSEGYHIVLSNLFTVCLSINGRALLCEVNNNHVFCNQLKKSYQLVSGLAVGGNGQKPLGLMNPLNRYLDI